MHGNFLEQIKMSKRVVLKQGDCLQVMQKIPDKSVDMILCDLPYGISACKWDRVISFDKLWKQYERVIKNEGAIVLFAVQPFTSKLILSNEKLYKYNWYWVKSKAANFLNKRYQPGKIIEDVCVFGKSATSYSRKGVNMKYIPQLEYGKPYKTSGGNNERLSSSISGRIKNIETINNGERLPDNVLRFNPDKKKIHPTQKPVSLLEYLIRTYTNENDIVLDNCMGSGSTGVACIKNNRKFIGIELDDEYYSLAKRRIRKAIEKYG